MVTASPPVSPSVVAATLMIQKPNVTSGTLPKAAAAPTVAAPAPPGRAAGSSAPPIWAPTHAPTMRPPQELTATMTAPVAISSTPIQAEGDKRSPRKRAPNTATRTTLSLSTGATADARPIRSALK